MKVTEFLGLPGAGKTSVAMAVSAELRGSGKRAATLKDLHRLRRRGIKKLPLIFFLFYSFYAFTFFITRMSLVKHVITFSYHVIPSKSDATRRGIKFLRLIFKQHTDIVLAEKWGIDFLLLDQGILQGIWSFVVEKGTPSESDCTLILNAIENSDSKIIPATFIYLNTNPNLAAMRISQRSTSTSYFDNFSCKENVDNLCNFSPLFHRIIGSVTKVAPAKVHVVRNDVEINYSVSEILKILEQS